MSDKTDNLKKRLLEAMEKSLGVVTQACKKANISRETYYQYYRTDPEFKEKIDSIQDIALDFAETMLMKNISEGDTTSTIFFLKTKGKKRGYIEKSEVEHSGKIIGDITVNVKGSKSKLLKEDGN